MVAEQLREWSVFAREALRARHVCSVVPSTLVTVRKVCRDIPTDRPVFLAEYGPGTGVFTRYLANRLHPESCILAIERNQGFYQELCRWRRVANPRCRLILEHADCREVRKLRRRYRLPAFDYVLSGIPFSMLTERDRDQIVRATFESLGANGSFLLYQTTPRMSTRLSKVFDRVERDWSWFNFPPLAILRARKHRRRKTPKAKRRCRPLLSAL